MADYGYHSFIKDVCILVVLYNARCGGSKSNCPVPEVQNGYILDQNREFKPGDMASIQCMEGYRHVGITRLRCRQRGVWLDNPPYCEEIRCGKLPTLLNGTITYPDKWILPREHVNISCDKGFLLHGPEKLQCTDDGSWEPYEMLYCQELQCPDLPQLMNGLVHPREPTRPGKVEFICNHGFILIGHSSINCNSDGTWVPNIMPFCREMRCPKLPRLANGIISSRNSTAFPGKSITFSCYDGYILHGPERMVCSTNGTWEPYEMVYCVQVPSKVNVFSIIMVIDVCALLILIVFITAALQKRWRKRVKTNKNKRRSICDPVITFKVP